MKLKVLLQAYCEIVVSVRRVSDGEIAIFGAFEECVLRCISQSGRSIEQK